MKSVVHVFSKKSFLLTLISCLIMLLNSNKANAQTTPEKEEENTESSAPKVKNKEKKNVFRYNNIISVYPFQSVINYMTLAYEFKTGEKTAFKTIAGYAKKEGGLLNISNITNYSGYRVELQFKYFINKKAEVFNGTYIAPFALFKSCQYTYDEDKWAYDPITGNYTHNTLHADDKASVFHVGFILGYHAKLGESFTLDMFAGEGLMSASGNYKYGSRIFDIYANEIRMKVGMSFGFGF